MKFDMWNTETKSITSSQQLYHETHEIIPPSHNSILRWVYNFPEHGTAEIGSRPEKLSMTSEDEQNISK